MHICGVDPGLKGAIALFRPGLLKVWDIPIFEVQRNGKTKNEINYDALGEIFFGMPEDTHGFVEKVGAMPGQGVTSMFAFGDCYGAIKGAMAAVKIPRAGDPTPQAWQKVMQARGGKDGSRQRATQLLPAYADLWRLVKYDGRAEAALIAMYGWMQLNGGKL